MLNSLKLVCLSALFILPTSAWSDVQITITDLKGKPIRDAVVFLKSPTLIAQSKPLMKAEIAQKNREFVPSVRVVTVGTPVDFPNRDDVLHHVYSFSPAKSFELKLYADKPKAPIVFDKAGIVELGCNIHDSMLGWVVVNNTPVYGRTDEQGIAVFPGQNEERYQVDVWHRNFPYGAPFETFKLDNQDTFQHTLRLQTAGVTL